LIGLKFSEKGSLLQLGGTAVAKGGQNGSFPNAYVSNKIDRRYRYATAVK